MNTSNNTNHSEVNTNFQILFIEITLGKPKSSKHLCLLYLGREAGPSRSLRKYSSRHSRNQTRGDFFSAQKYHHNSHPKPRRDLWGLLRFWVSRKQNKETRNALPLAHWPCDRDWVTPATHQPSFQLNLNGINVVGGNSAQKVCSICKRASAQNPQRPRPRMEARGPISGPRWGGGASLSGFTLSSKVLLTQGMEAV